jgi:predicted TIM-barrel fold metal-dependent hydrolase
VIASMDQYGVDISVIMNFGFGTMEMCHETNDYILEAVARYPKRLLGFCTIQPKAGKAALAELELCFRGGAKGIGEMMPDRQGFELDDEAVMGPIVDFAISHKLPFLTHSSEPVGHQYPGKGDVTPDKLYRFLTKFPQLTIVLAHWGGGLPFYALMPEVKKAMANTFVDTAASVYLFRPQVFTYVADLIGAEKILFATDFPVISQRRLIQEVKSLNLPPQTEALIMGENARKLLCLPESTPSGG